MGVVEVVRLAAAGNTALGAGEAVWAPAGVAGFVASRGADEGAPFCAACFASRWFSLFSMTWIMFWTVSKFFSSSRILLTISALYCAYRRLTRIGIFPMLSWTSFNDGKGGVGSLRFLEFGEVGVDVDVGTVVVVVAAVAASPTLAPASPFNSS